MSWFPSAEVVAAWSWSAVASYVTGVGNRLPDNSRLNLQGFRMRGPLPSDDLC